VAPGTAAGAAVAAGAPAPRVGVLGGTFDPVHIGHLVAAVTVRHELALDRVLLMVANEPWQKTGVRQVTRASERLAMVEAAVRGLAGIEASSLEIDRGGVSYTVDTLRELQRIEPSSELFVIVGQDVAAEIHTWERPDELRQLAELVVVTRPGVAPLVDLGPGWRSSLVEVPRLEISSTDLRWRAATGRPLDFLVPAATIQRIVERALYAVDR
jgi:nicotinate-nucleotide adenylyltransferase